MCDRCDAIDQTIVRYRWLMEQVLEHQVNQNAEDLIAKLEEQKRSLHSELAD